MKLRYEEIETNKHLKLLLICEKKDKRFEIDLGKQDELLFFIDLYKNLTAHNEIIYKDVGLNLREFAFICEEIFKTIQKLYDQDQRWN